MTLVATLIFVSLHKMLCQLLWVWHAHALKSCTSDEFTRLRLIKKTQTVPQIAHVLYNGRSSFTSPTNVSMNTLNSSGFVSSSSVGQFTLLKLTFFLLGVGVSCSSPRNTLPRRGSFVKYTAPILVDSCLSASPSVFIASWTIGNFACWLCVSPTNM